MKGLVKRVTPAIYKNSMGWPFFALVASVLVAYVGLAIAKVDVPPEMALFVGTVLGNRQARTMKPIREG